VVFNLEGRGHCG